MEIASPPFWWIAYILLSFTDETITFILQYRQWGKLAAEWIIYPIRLHVQYHCLVQKEFLRSKHGNGRDFDKSNVTIYEIMSACVRMEQTKSERGWGINKLLKMSVKKMNNKFFKSKLGVITNML